MILNEYGNKKSKRKSKGVDIHAHPMADRLKQLLDKEIVDFTFIRLDGHTRHAVGTRNIDIVKVVGGKGEIPKGTGKVSPRVVPFWDLQKKKWRCFRRDRVAKIGKHYNWNGEQTDFGTYKESREIVMKDQDDIILNMRFDRLLDNFVESLKNDRITMKQIDEAVDIYSERLQRMNLPFDTIQYFFESAMKELEEKKDDDFLVIPKKYIRKAEKLVKDIEDLYNYTDTKKDDWLDIYDENDDLFCVKDFEWDENTATFSWFEKDLKSYKKQEPTKQYETFIISGEFDDYEFEDFIKYWNKHIKRTKKFYEMNPDDLDKILSGEKEDSEEDEN